MIKHKKVKWLNAYEQNYPEEAFAESFAKYYHSAKERAKLWPEVRQFLAEVFD